MIRNLLKPSTSITGAAILVGFFSVLSRVLGFVRDRLLAGSFGASLELDAYYSAFRIPDTLYQILIVGALSATFIPLFTKYLKQKGEDSAWNMTSNVLNVSVLSFLVFSLIAFVFRGQVINLVAPGIDEAGRVLAIDLMQYLLLAQIFLSFSMVFGSVLQSTRRFFLYSLAPIFYNFGIIFGIAYLVPQFGIHGVVYGVLMGAFLHALIQYIGVRNLGYRYRLILKPMAKSVKYILTHTPARMASLALAQIAFTVMVAFASRFGEGSITVLQFAYNLNFFPVGVFGVSYAIASFPVLCKEVKDSEKFIRTVSNTVKQLIFFLLPVIVITVLLRTQIVRAVVGAGLFDWEATVSTANLLAIFALSFIPQAIIYLIVRAYFALEDTKTPVFIMLGSLAVQIALTLLLQTWDLVGLVLAFSISSWIQMIVLWLLLRIRLGTLEEVRIFKAVMPLVLATTMVIIGVQWTKFVFGAFVGRLDTFFEIVGQISVSSAVGLVFYAFFALAFNSEEMRVFLSSLQASILRKAKSTESITQSTSN